MSLRTDHGRTLRRRAALRSMSTAALVLVFSAVNADTLLVVRKSDHALDIVDPGSGLRLAIVPVGHAPHEVSRSPDGRFAAVTNYGTRDRPGSTVSVIDIENPRELRRVDLGQHRRPHGVAWYANDRVAVTTEGSRHLLLIDPRAGRVVSAIGTGHEGSHMVAVTPDRTRAFVTNLASGTTSGVDLAGGRKLGDVETGAGSEAIAVTPDGREVWVAARQAGTITVFDARSLAVLQTIPVTGGPIRIAITQDNAALVSCAASSEVVSFDVRMRRETARRTIDIKVAASAVDRASAGVASGSVVPVGLALSADGASVYVAATAADRVVHLTVPGLDVLRVIDIAGEPDGMALTPVMPKAACHACEAPPDPFVEK